MSLNEFTAKVKQIQAESPGLTYKEAQIRAKKYFEQQKSANVEGKPQFAVQGSKKTEPSGKPEFDVDEIEKMCRAGNGRMYLMKIMHICLGDRKPTLVTDKKQGVNTLCHIECEGFRIPADGGYFKFF